MGVASQITLRHDGPAMVVGTAALREKLVRLLAESHITVTEAEDPYAAMGEIARHQPAYTAVVFSLQSLYREELEVIAVLRRRFPLMEVWLTDLEGRSAALADAMRLGATGLLDDEGLHRLQEVAPAAGVLAADLAEPAARQAVARNAPEGLAASEDRNATPASAHLKPSAAVEAADIEERPVMRPNQNGPRRKRRAPAAAPAAPAPKASEPPASPRSPDEPVLTAEELRALLQDQPGLPPLRQE